MATPPRCSVCRSGKPARLPSASMAPLDSFAFAPAYDQVSGAMEPPLSIDLVTRFLCGIKTPRMIQSKAASLSAFGQLRAYPYREVSDWVAKSLGR